MRSEISLGKCWQQSNDEPNKPKHTRRSFEGDRKKKMASFVFPGGGSKLSTSKVMEKMTISASKCE